MTWASVDSTSTGFLLILTAFKFNVMTQLPDDTCQPVSFSPYSCLYVYIHISKYG